MRKQHEDSGNATMKENESPASHEEEAVTSNDKEASWPNQEEQDEYDDDYYHEKFSRKSRDRRNLEKIPKRKDKTDW